MRKILLIIPLVIFISCNTGSAKKCSAGKSAAEQYNRFFELSIHTDGSKDASGNPIFKQKTPSEDEALEALDCLHASAEQDGCEAISVLIPMYEHGAFSNILPLKKDEVRAEAYQDKFDIHCAK